MPLRRSPSIPKTYAELERRVVAVWIGGRREMETAWVKMYHETGRLTHEHVLLKQERGPYGGRVVAQLAARLQVDRSVVHRCVRFARLFPIVADRRQLGWAHYRVLIDIDDAALREKLAAAAACRCRPRVGFVAGTLTLRSRDSDGHLAVHQKRWKVNLLRRDCCKICNRSRSRAASGTVDRTSTKIGRSC